MLSSALGSGFHVVDLDGNYIDQVDGPFDPVEAAALDDVRGIATRGGIIVTLSNNATCNLRCYDASTLTLNWARTVPPATAAGFFDPGFYWNLAIGSDGSIYVPSDNKVLIFSACGTPGGAYTHTTDGSNWIACSAVSDVSVVTGGKAFACDAGGSDSFPDTTC